MQYTCFFQVNSSFINIPRNFVLLIGTICWLSYVMPIFEIDLLVAVNCIKCIICVGGQKSYMFHLGKTTTICLVLHMWVKEAITQL